MEDYRATAWPAAHRLLILRGPSGREVRRRLADGGAGKLTTLVLYARRNAPVDGQGQPLDGSFLLVGARDCVAFDPVFLIVGACHGAPPNGSSASPDLLRLGRFDWANGFDPPRGRFGLGWRFLQAEDEG